jgi:hypothetical protein
MTLANGNEQTVGMTSTGEWADIIRKAARADQAEAEAASYKRRWAALGEYVGKPNEGDILRWVYKLMWRLDEEERANDAR